MTTWPTFWLFFFQILIILLALPLVAISLSLCRFLLMGPEKPIKKDTSKII